MKTLCLLFTLLLANMVSAQNTIGTRDYYLAKSNQQKKIGTILIMGGAVTMLIGGAIGTQSKSDFDYLGEKVLIVGAGLAIGLAGVPFMINGGRYARKAASIGVSNQTILVPKGNSLIARKLPCVSMKISL